MSPRFALGRENVRCVAEVVNRSLKADCTDSPLLELNQICCDQILSYDKSLCKTSSVLVQKDVIMTQ